MTLWEARANLIAKYGFATGNQLILQLVTDGMNLSPSNPNFLQARNGILQADVVNNGGANQGELWTAFAKRGMGSSATSPASSTTVGLVEAYDIPDSLSVSLTTGLTSSGPVGGPFTPATKSFTLVNIGTNNVAWAGTSTVAWLTLSQTNGVLAPGATSSVIVAINASANNLVAGIYNGTVRFTNVTSGVVQSRAFVLRIGQRDYFTELFDGGDNDLDNQTLTFTPDGSTNFYSVCREPAFVFPTDPIGGTNLALSGHSFLTLNLATNISIYGRATNRINLAAEGHITLNAGDSSGTVTLANHFSLPRVSALFAHIHPTESGGTVSWMQLSNRVAIHL